jgi:shikimate dehydrogenase
LTLSGATRVAAVIGDPVRHSLSPALHNAAYQALDLDWVYVAFEVPDGATHDALDAVRTLGLAGLSVTMPHKTAAADWCDDLTPDAAALRSVNTVTPDAHGRLVGDSTDGEGFLRSLRDAGHDPAGTTAVVVGAGGAARAVARALAGAGATVVVTARRAAAASLAARLAGAAGSSVPWEQRARAAADAELVVNATPVGMAGVALAAAAEDLPLDAGALHEGQVLADLVYHPIETPLLRAAQERGVEVVDGLGMLVHQAALQVERWTGRPAPVAAMRAAAEAALAARAHG